MRQDTEYEALSEPAKAIVDRAIVEFTNAFRPNPHDITLRTLRASFGQPGELARLAKKYGLEPPPECTAQKSKVR